jgi:hypothetical protein
MIGMVISPEADTADKRVAFLYRMEQRLVNKLNSLVGTRDYQAYHDDVFTPTLTRIHGALADARKTARNLPEPSFENNDYINARQTFREDDRYDTVIERDNPEVR